MNIRQKGHGAEREVATLLNGILILTMREMGFPEETVVKAATSVQRNQNQSAVGGGDLSNTFGLCIEIKRHETLQIETWWKQCEASAKRNSEWPVLLYRQNNRAWRCVTYVTMSFPDGSGRGLYPVRADISYSDFQSWYRHWIKTKLQQGEAVRI